MTEKGRQFF